MPSFSTRIRASTPAGSAICPSAMTMAVCSPPRCRTCSRAIITGTAFLARRSPSNTAALNGTTPGVTSSNFRRLAIAWTSAFFSWNSEINGSTAGAPMRTRARRHS